MTELIGKRIRFLKTLDQPANEETLAFVFAYKGELGNIIDVVDGVFMYSVKVDRWKTTFGANRDEFEILEESNG